MTTTLRMGTMYSKFDGILSTGQVKLSDLWQKPVSAPSLALVATGGTVTTVGDTEQVHKFTASSTFQVTRAGTATVVIVGGGAGGGGRAGGGGGAGGLLAFVQPVSAGTYSIIVGAGGAGGGGTGITGYNGGDSSAFGFTAIGGGGGGSDYNESGIKNEPGKSGGCGGGGRYGNAFQGSGINFNNGGAGTSGQGYGGGGSIDSSLSTTSQWKNGGGGGAGSVGMSGSVSAIGNGGDGKSIRAFATSAVGSPVGWLAGGGGGGSHDPTPAGLRGLGGAGGGGNGGDPNNKIAMGAYMGSHGDNAVAATGGGGGAGVTAGGNGGNGGNGGTGIVLVRYTTFHPSGPNTANKLVTCVRATSASTSIMVTETYSLLSTVTENTSMAQFYFETYNPQQVLFVNKHVTDSTASYGFNDVLLLVRTGASWPFTIGSYAGNVSTGFKMFYKKYGTSSYTLLSNAQYSTHGGFEDSTFSFTAGVASGYGGNTDKRIILGPTRKAGSSGTGTLHNFIGNTSSDSNTWVPGGGIDIYMGMFALVN